MRRLAHAALVILAGLPWVISRVSFWISAQLVLLSDLVEPDSRWGNCHSFVVLMRRKHGGYTCERPAMGNARLFGLQIPHALWLAEIPEGAELMQTLPVKRSDSRFALSSFYFKFDIVTTEPPRRMNR